jgi:hypothetical protein
MCKLQNWQSFFVCVVWGGWLSLVGASTDKTNMPGNSLARVAKAFEAPGLPLHQSPYFFEIQGPIIYYMGDIDSDNCNDNSDDSDSDSNSDSDETDSNDSGIGSEIDSSKDNNNNDDNDNDNNNDNNK